MCEKKMQNVAVYTKLVYSVFWGIKSDMSRLYERQLVYCFAKLVCSSTPG